MNSLRHVLLSAALIMTFPLASEATPATDALLARYTAEGGQAFSAQKGRSLWQQKMTGNGGQQHACTDCHGVNISEAGRHAKTQKTIRPMSAAVSSNRYQQEKKVEKWFKRNCKWTWGRECTPQEKGDILSYLLAQ